MLSVLLELVPYSWPDSRSFLLFSNIKFSLCGNFCDEKLVRDLLTYFWSKSLLKEVQLEGLEEKNGQNFFNYKYHFQ